MNAVMHFFMQFLSEDLCGRVASGKVRTQVLVLVLMHLIAAVVYEPRVLVVTCIRAGSLCCLL